MGDAVDNGPAALGADNPAALGANNSAAKGVDDGAAMGKDDHATPGTDNAATLGPTVSPIVAMTLGVDAALDKAMEDRGGGRCLCQGPGRGGRRRRFRCRRD